MMSSMLSPRMLWGAVLAGAALLLTPACTSMKPKEEISVRGHFPDGTGVTGQHTDADGTLRDGTNGQWDGTGTPGQQADAGLFGTPETRRDERREAGEPHEALRIVYFAYDDSELTSDAQGVLAANAAYLKDHPAMMVVLRGHTDERGTPEYNLALGSRRAMSVRDYLVSQGIDPDRLDTVSFGDSLPASDGTSEEDHALNRRVEFFVYLEE